MGKLAANEDLESLEIPTGLPIADPHTNALQGNLLRENERKFAELPEDQKLTKLCSDAGSKIVEKGQFFITLDEEGPDEMKNLCREFRCREAKKHPSERVVSRKHENRSGLGCEGLTSPKTLPYRNHGRIPVSRQNSFLGSNCEWH